MAALYRLKTKAVIIAFTSEAIPRLLYRMTISPDFTLEGYVNSSLSYFNTSDFSTRVQPKPIVSNSNYTMPQVELCRYAAYRYPPWSPKKYEHTEYYWHLLAIRFAFVLVFENVVVITSTLIRWIIPDVPKKLMEQIRHENFITNEMIIAQELRRAKGLSAIPEDQALASPEMLDFMSGYESPGNEEDKV